MDIRISRREVLNNIIRLKDRLLEQKEEKRQGKWGRRFYRALLNRQTGDIRFIKEGIHFHPSEEWKEILFDVDAHELEAAHFEAHDEKNLPIEPRGLEPLAWRIFAETLETLNLIASQHVPNKPDILPEEAALEDLSEIHLSEIAGSIEELPGWQGNIDRIEAEKRLKNELPGTYVLRHAGSMTQVQAKGLSQSNKISVKPYLITMKDIDKKMDERLILQTDRGWTLYRDNPDLKDSEYVYYHSPQEALRKLEPRAKKALKE